MKVLLIIPENTGTIASVSYDLYIGLCKQANTTVYVACLGPYIEAGFQFHNVTRLESSKGLIHSIKSRFIGLKRLKKRLKIDISISTLLGATYWNVLSGIGEYKIGVFHTRLSQTKYGGIIFYFVNYILNKILCVRLDKMIAVNRSAFLDLKALHRKKACIELVYNIHNIQKIKDLSIMPITDNTETAIFNNKIILYVGNLYCTIKGTDRLIKAFANVHVAFPLYKLVFIGGDPDNSMRTLNELVLKYALTDSVYFLGRKDNPYKYIENAEMLVSPSRDEGLPGVLIEALAIGKKCVATNSSIGVWEIMQCANDFDAKLKDIYQTKFGIICPNDLNDENYTVDKLSLAIKTCITTDYNDIKDFDTSRFSEEEIIPHYIKNMRI